MSNFTFAKDYLLHRLKANNRHGIHSPFVYTLIDKVIYDYQHQEAYNEIEAAREGIAESEDLKPKVARLLYRLTKHFNPATIVELGKVDPITKFCLQKAAPDARFYAEESSAAKIDLIYINATDSKEIALKYFEESLPKMQSDTVMIFADIYKNIAMKQAWAQIKAHSQVTLTIDLFWLGLVFFKSGRAEKEHFRVKY